jgi:hypothetical protein
LLRLGMLLEPFGRQLGDGFPAHPVPRTNGSRGDNFEALIANP